MLTRCFFPIDPPTSPPVPHLSQCIVPQARHCNPVYLLPITFTTLHRDTNLSRSIARQQPESILRKICQCSSRDIELHPRCNSLLVLVCKTWVVLILPTVNGKFDGGESRDPLYLYQANVAVSSTLSQRSNITEAVKSSVDETQALGLVLQYSDSLQYHTID